MKISTLVLAAGLLGGMVSGAFAGNHATTVQLGGYNRAYTSQYGQRNQATTVQFGYYNRAYTSQFGRSNYAATGQLGSYNNSAIHQYMP